jgi:3-dehydroquinate synthase
MLSFKPWPAGNNRKKLLAMSELSSSALRIAATVPVNLGARSYDIAIGSGLLPHAAELLQQQLSRKKTAIVTDANVAQHHLASLQNSLDAAGIKHQSIILTPGEATKSYAGLAEVCDKLLAAGIERKDHVIALGGGVIGDLAGFAASVLRRGVNFIQIPTSLLAQVDSSVGGKTGINSPLGKNLVGAFHQPSKVLIDLDLLKTLPMRQRAAGYAEIAKYGLLGDAPFFQWLETNVDGVLNCGQGVVDHAVRVSCETKARIVAEDETETGVRALLNLGHTFGHALEASTGYSDVLLHGEAVAIGMVQAFRFSEAQNLCAHGTADRVEKHLARAGLPTHVTQINANLPPANEMVEIMRQDKKASAGKLTFILTRGLGEAFIARDVDDKLVTEFLKKDMQQK